MTALQTNLKSNLTELQAKYYNLTMELEAVKTDIKIVSAAISVTETQTQQIAEESAAATVPSTMPAPKSAPKAPKV